MFQNIRNDYFVKYHKCNHKPVLSVCVLTSAPCLIKSLIICEVFWEQDSLDIPSEPLAQNDAIINGVSPSVKYN